LFVYLPFPAGGTKNKLLIVKLLELALRAVLHRTSGHQKTTEREKKSEVGTKYVSSSVRLEGD
jgi:hypothetical protein